MPESGVMTEYIEIIILKSISIISFPCKLLMIYCPILYFTQDLW